MCRRNQVCGCVLIAFGFGLLVGLCLESGFFFSFMIAFGAGLLLGLFLESGFFCAVIGLGLMALGIWCFGRK